ncbi:MAG: hypothetical protein ACLUW6_00290 [Coriobacteriaceae bacterium]
MPEALGEGVANNRKLYSPRTSTGSSRSWCSLLWIRAQGYAADSRWRRSLTDALAERIENACSGRFLQHLILFARYAELVGDDLFETGLRHLEVDASPSSCEARRLCR